VVSEAGRPALHGICHRNVGFLSHLAVQNGACRAARVRATLEFSYPREAGASIGHIDPIDDILNLSKIEVGSSGTGSYTRKPDSPPRKLSNWL